MMEIFMAVELGAMDTALRALCGFVVKIFFCPLASSTRRGNQPQVRKICAHARRIARQQPVSGHRRMCADKKIRQRRKLVAASPPVAHEGFPRKKSHLLGDGRGSYRMTTSFRFID